MPPKRPQRRGPGQKPWIRREPEAPQVQPQNITCPGCGATAAVADHSCPQCGQLFYERPHGQVGREHNGKPSRHDPDIARFARRMEEMEKWTRVICTVAGVMFGLLALLFLAAPFRLPLIGLRVAIAGAFIFLVLAGACLRRGLGPRDADLDGLGK